jgi:hypothetical protein
MYLFSGFIELEVLDEGRICGKGYGASQLPARFGVLEREIKYINVYLSERGRKWALAKTRRGVRF